MNRIRRILCASDFSSTSRKALAAAISLAKTHRAGLIILHAHVPIGPLMPERYIESSTWDRVDTDARRWIKSQVAKAADRAKKLGVRASAIMVMGDPATQIVRVARSKRIDLIVVGTHGRRGMSKFFLGSVAERVIATAPCPVMTVRGR